MTTDAGSVLPFADVERAHTFMIDPPWPERGGGKIKRGADRHYDVLKVDQIEGVIRGSGVFDPADDAHLYLWYTNNYLEAALALVRRLGFVYKTQITWAKPHSGIGQYFRGKTEHMMFATKGEGMRLRRQWTARRDLPTLLTVDWVRSNGRIVHSAKPPEAYALIEAASPPPYQEIFARAPRPGWRVWGNEVEEGGTDA